MSLTFIPAERRGLVSQIRVRRAASRSFAAVVISRAGRTRGEGEMDRFLAFAGWVWTKVDLGRKNVLSNLPVRISEVERGKLLGTESLYSSLSISSGSASGNWDDKDSGS